LIQFEGSGESTVAIDIHAHLGSAAQPGEDGGRSAALLAAMDGAGVDRACVFASVTRGSDYPVETELILSLSALTGGRVIPFARVHPFWGEEAVSQLTSAARAGVKGLKLHPYMDGAFMANDVALVHPLVRVAADHGLVVLVHSGWGFNSAPGIVADLARAFPSVSVVMGHAGRYGYHREAAAVGADLSNLTFDVAGLATPSAVVELIGLVGPERVLFGTDHPYSPVGFELEKVARWTGLPWPQVALVVGGNAARLLGVDRGPQGPTIRIERGPSSSQEAGGNDR
jgi:predicted TIM-barrel fold metal-dependent hydrolase